MMNEKSTVTYTDIVMMVHESVKDVSDDNGCEFDTNLYYFIEGLIEDVNELEAGRELRHIPVRPKTTKDAE